MGVHHHTRSSPDLGHATKRRGQAGKMELEYAWNCLWFIKSQLQTAGSSFAPFQGTIHLHLVGCTSCRDHRGLQIPSAHVPALSAHSDYF